MSIFDEGNKITGSWASFKTVGDKYEGTLIGRRDSINKLSGLPQVVYELKGNGETILIGGKPAIDAQMNHVKLGQIVGFEFTEERAPKVPGHNPTKIIQVFANPAMVDKEWMDEHEATALAGEFGGEVVGSGEPTYEPVGEATDPATPDFSVEGEINELAKSKLGAKTDAEIKAKVMESTKLAFIEENYAPILEALKKL